MSKPQMSGEEFERIYNELLDSIEQLIMGKEPERLLELVVKRIEYLNQAIDAMDTLRTSQDYLIIDLCYQYYRIKDRLEAQG